MLSKLDSATITSTAASRLTPPALRSASGAESATIHADRLDDLRADAARELGRDPERAAALVRHAWRSAEEFNVNTGLWLDALFVQLRRSFA